MHNFKSNGVAQFSLKELSEVPDSTSSGFIRRELINRAVDEFGSYSKERTRIEMLPTLPPAVYAFESVDKQSNFEIRKTFWFIKYKFPSWAALSFPLLYSIFLAFISYYVTESSQFFNKDSVINANSIYITLTGVFFHLLLRKPSLMKLYKKRVLLFNLFCFAVVSIFVSFYLSIIFALCMLVSIVVNFLRRVDIDKNYAISTDTYLHGTEDRELLDLNEHPLTLCSLISYDICLEPRPVSKIDAVAAVIGYDLLLIGCDLTSFSQITSIGPSSITAYSAVLSRASGNPCDSQPVFTETLPWPCSLSELEARFEKLVSWGLTYIGVEDLRSALLLASSDLSSGSNGYDRASRVAGFLLDKATAMYRQ
ncbi:MAG: hypothetical protein ACKOW9_05005 [Candidatus Paceibacterota bacterium]